MYLTQQKTYNKPNLPPLSSLLKDSKYKLPSIDTFSVPSGTASYSSSIASTPISTSSPAPGMVPPVGANASRNNSYSDENDGKVNKSNKKSDKSFAFISHSVNSFPSQEPSIDNAPLARRKRRRTSPNELNILNQEFLLGNTPNKLRRVEIANKVNMTEKAIQIWFQNKRQSLRKQSINDKEITELPPTPSEPSIISSTPIKPMLNKSQSFSSPENIRLQTTSPIKQRSLSANSVANTNTSLPSVNTANTSMNSTMNDTTRMRVLSTPNTSIMDDSNVSIDSSINNHLILNETKKKQPMLLNSSNSSTMTFKLGPKFKVHEDNTSTPAAPNKIQNLLNNVSDERKPLGQINQNNRKVKNDDECAENLLSLREGNWK